MNLVRLSHLLVYAKEVSSAFENFPHLRRQTHNIARLILALMLVDTEVQTYGSKRHM